jgi:hypothetical protein
VKLVEIEKLIPASYNPRKVDPDRLALVELSIKKLGWLLPVYATETGELLSGHQRTHVARTLGYTHAPTVIMPAMDDRARKAINILFNRSTNDMDIDTVSSEIKQQLLALNPHKLADSLPDLRDSYACMEAKRLPIEPYVKANSGNWIQYARNVSGGLFQKKIFMPIVVDDRMQVVNGIGRLQLAAEKKQTHADFVILDSARAEFAKAMLNLLSMDFAVEEKYADLLRFNSFRRLIRTRSELGRGFVFSVIGNKPAHTFDVKKPTHLAAWRKKHGNVVVDFGAGHLHETDLLRSFGVDVTPFEPFHVNEKEQIDKEKSKQIACEFLEAVASGKQWSSVFISSVLNSVPFLQDRKHIVKIVSALCSPTTNVFAVASSEQQRGFLNATKKFLSKSELSHSKMLLNYEDNVMLGDIADAPKVQKYHTPEMFYDLFKSAFKRVQVGYDVGINVYALAKNPLPLEGLKEALEFEFDLPYPDGSKMNMTRQAISAFEKRLGVKL